MLWEDDLVDSIDQAARELRQVTSIEYLSLDNAICVPRCYVSIRIARQDPSFSWDTFVADVFGVHGNERAVENGKRHLTEIYQQCSGVFDLFLEETAVSEFEESLARELGDQ